MKQKNGFLALLWTFLKGFTHNRSPRQREQDYYALGLILLWLLLFLRYKLKL